MASLWYLSRTDGAHDRRWTALLRDHGHGVETLDPSVTVEGLRAHSARMPPDGIVAGPLTDAVPKAVEADVAPVLGICWAFDVLIEADDAGARRRLETALRGASLVHADSDYLRQRLVSLGMDDSRISVAPWGIDLDFFTPGPRDNDLRTAAGLDANDVVVLTTRSWEPRYAVDVVLEGFASARQSDPRLRLAWAGSGSLDRALTARADQLGIVAATRRLGHLDPEPLRAWLHSADVYASAARTDGTSLSLLEALACAIPVLVTDLPSNREWVLDGEVGGLFRRDDAEAFAAALLELLARPGSPGRRREVVEQRGDWRRNQQVFLAAVDRLVAGVA